MRAKQTENDLQVLDLNGGGVCEGVVTAKGRVSR